MSVRSSSGERSRSGKRCHKGRSPSPARSSHPACPSASSSSASLDVGVQAGVMPPPPAGHPGVDGSHSGGDCLAALLALGLRVWAWSRSLRQLLGRLARSMVVYHTFLG